MCDTTDRQHRGVLESLVRRERPTASVVHVDYDRDRALCVDGDEPFWWDYTMNEGQPVALAGQPRAAAQHAPVERRTAAEWDAIFAAKAAEMLGVPIEVLTASVDIHLADAYSSARKAAMVHAEMRMQGATGRIAGMNKFRSQIWGLDLWR